MPEKSKTYEKSAPRVYIRTFGCQMNDRDSEAVLGLFLDRGYMHASEPKEADIILVNTCSVRMHAEDRAISLLGTFKKLTNKPVVGLLGCMARNRGEEIFKRMPHVDLIIGPAHFDKLPDYVERIQEEGIRIIGVEDNQRSEVLYHPLFRNESSHAQVVISTGCRNHCSYCVVPFVRGPLRPRAPQDIIEEVKQNVNLGIGKITLLGQNVNDYQYKFQITNSKFQIVSFVNLLKMVEELEGVEEIDFITSHPKNTSLELFNLMACSSKFRKHLHLPFQSGSNRILELMNRGYTKEAYLRLTDNYKNIVDGTLSTDVIVGYPQETEEDFLETKDVLERVKFKFAYIFKYSPRPNTKASKLTDDVPKEVKERRHKVLLDLQKEISLS